MKTLYALMIAMPLVMASCSKEKSYEEKLEYVIRKTISKPDNTWHDTLSTVFYEKRFGDHVQVLFMDKSPHVTNERIIGSEDKTKISYVSDVLFFEGSNSVEGYRKINNEITQFSPSATTDRTMEILREIRKIHEKTNERVYAEK